MEDEFPDDDQRYAVCQNRWDRDSSKGGDEMQYKTKKVPFELKEFDEETGVFEGYAAVFGNVDDGNDLIEKGAFKKTLQENAHRVKICWQHDFKKPIGKPLEMREDNHGLYVKGKISKTSLGEDVITLLKDKVIDELSIGYNAVKKNWKDGVRYLKEIKLYEFSPVTIGMNNQALITNVKSLEDRFDTKQDVMTEMEEQELQEQRWKINRSFDEVIEDLLSDEEMNSQEKLDSFNQSLEQYNNLMTAWFEAMLELGVKTFDYTEDDDKKDKNTSLELALYSIIGQESTKEGRVLSASNRKLVKNAVDALQSLLEATEPEKSTQKQKEADNEPDNDSTHETKEDVTVDDILEDLTTISNTLTKNNKE